MQSPKEKDIRKQKQKSNKGKMQAEDKHQNEGHATT
jgi:hypothetical protein